MCAVTIGAPAARVWPWLVQIGCRRAGWYSYDLLDNGGQPSADRILPEHQHLAAGDEILLTPKGPLAMPVAALETEKALVLGGTINTATGEGVEPGDPLPEAYYTGINAFLLEPAGEGATRLLFRQRLDWNPRRLNTLIYRGFLEPISFVMARRMLKGIERRTLGISKGGNLT
jgi:proline iminopeptidase